MTLIFGMGLDLDLNLAGIVGQGQRSRSLGNINLICLLCMCVCVCRPVSIMPKGLSGKRTVHEGIAGGKSTLRHFHCMIHLVIT